MPRWLINRSIVSWRQSIWCRYHLGNTAFVHIICGFSSSVGPCTDFNYLLASLKIVVGVVAKWVLPLKYLTFRFWNSYVVPFFTLLMDSSQMWITAVPVLSSNTQSSLTSVIFSVDFTSTGLGSSLPTEMVAVTCHDFLVYLWSWYLSQNDRDSGLHWKGE